MNVHVTNPSCFGTEDSLESFPRQQTTAYRSHPRSLPLLACLFACWHRQYDTKQSPTRNGARLISIPYLPILEWVPERGFPGLNLLVGSRSVCYSVSYFTPETGTYFFSWSAGRVLVLRSLLSTYHPNLLKQGRKQKKTSCNSEKVRWWDCYTAIGNIFLFRERRSSQGNFSNDRRSAENNLHSHRTGATHCIGIGIDLLLSVQSPALTCLAGPTLTTPLGAPARPLISAAAAAEEEPRPRAPHRGRPIIITIPAHIHRLHESSSSSQWRESGRPTTSSGRRPRPGIIRANPLWAPNWPPSSARTASRTTTTTTARAASSAACRPSAPCRSGRGCSARLAR